MSTPRKDMKDPRVLDLFHRQFGVATAAQLRDAGLARRSIARALERGTLTGVVSGLYLLAGHTMEFRTRAMAAQLHFPRGFLDGSTAGAIHGLRSMPRSLIRVSHVGRVSRVVPPWVRVTQVRAVSTEEVVAVGAFRVSHPRRMLLALAREFNLHRFARAAEDAWHLGLTSPHDMSRYLEHVRRSGLSGVALIDRWLASAVPRERPSQSGLELDALAAVRMAGLPEPERQHALALPSGEVIHLDIAWPDVRLAV
jgi:hypothetical protein